MKPRTQIMLGVAVLLAMAALSSMKRGWNAGRAQDAGACCPLMAALAAKPAPAATNRITTNAAAQQVIAYYFHGTVRCETCLMIEKLARMVVEQQFSPELAAHRLSFVPVNYDLPENVHFLTDYKLPCPSLVLVRQKEGKAEKWKLLGDTWQLVHEPVKLDNYVETEVRNFLSAQEQPTNTNQIGLLPAPDHR
jgi:hypothetical protein